MTIRSPSGVPPSSSSRVSSDAWSTSRSAPTGTNASCDGFTDVPSSVSAPVSTSTPCSYDGSTGISSVVPSASVISAPSSGVCVCDRRGVAEHGAEEDPRRPAVTVHRRRRVVLEPRLDRAAGVGQRHPQLGAVQRGRAAGGHLGVADPAAGGHQVDLAGAHDRPVAGAVTVLDLAGEQPADRLQPGVRVGGHDHAARVGDVVGAVVVEEAPGADHGAAAARQRAPYVHRAEAAERHLARLDHGHGGHVTSLPRRPRACSRRLPAGAGAGLPRLARRPVGAGGLLPGGGHDVRGVPGGGSPA